MANPDFTRKFGSTGTRAPITNTDYNVGWDNIAGGNPPRKTEFNSIDGEQDDKLAYVDERARGKWNATYDYIINELALGANGNWYISKTSNTNKEPSVSSIDWELYDIRLLSQATETATGVAELATQTETDAGTDDLRIVTPKKLRFGFSAVFASIGYIVFPSWLGGLIFQWGRHDQLGTPLSPGANILINQPLNIVFPNNIFVPIVIPSLFFVNAGGINPALASFDIIYSSNHTGALNLGSFWIAIGN